MQSNEILNAAVHDRYLRGSAEQRALRAAAQSGLQATARATSRRCPTSRPAGRRTSRPPPGGIGAGISADDALSPRRREPSCGPRRASRGNGAWRKRAKPREGRHRAVFPSATIRCAPRQIPDAAPAGAGTIRLDAESHGGLVVGPTTSPATRALTSAEAVILAPEPVLPPSCYRTLGNRCREEMLRPVAYKYLDKVLS